MVTILIDAYLKTMVSSAAKLASDAPMNTRRELITI